MKKLFIVISCVVLGICLSLGAVFFLINSLDKFENITPAGAPTSSVVLDTSSQEQTVEKPDTPTEENEKPQPEENKPQKPEKPPIEEKPFLTITTPKDKSFTTTKSTITFKGKTNVTTGVLLNGQPVKQPRSIDGEFTVTEKLSYGNNKFVFTAGKFSETFNITRKYVVAKDFSHEGSKTYDSGTSFTVSVLARANATVTATFNGKTISLKSETTTDNSFIKFKGKFTLPEGHLKDLDLGKITLKATYKDCTDTFTSKNIVCKKDKRLKDSDPSVTPKDDSYINVGSGLITEIVASTAETFNGKGSKDTSKPYYNYLPKGTLDYGSSDYATVKRDGDTYKLITLRCGKKIYKDRYDKPPHKKVAVAKQYVGTLPDHNEIGIASLTETNSHTVLTLDTMWKAPFEFKLKNQDYNNDYTVDSITYKYVDITFCYTTVFDGKLSIPKDHPLFSKAKIIKNDYDYTLRLYLKKQGAFYGWDAEYNDKGQLVFEFLKPAKITLTNNKYGADLSGVRILIDVGHGGIDPGTSRNNIQKYCEAARNLHLAKKLKAELEAIGATVYITRESDVTRSTDYKTQMLRKLKPDYCIAIHHDSNASSKLNGMGAYYYYPFSKAAAKYVLDNCFDTGIYKDKTFKWHYYYMSRVSVCPVVLTENGYYSNKYDYNNIIDNKVNTIKAEALTKGIVEYFTSIQ